jgi:hypothetical protein
VRSEVQIFPGPPFPLLLGAVSSGAIAQLGERLLCKQEVVGSIPSGSTSGERLPIVRENKKSRNAITPSKASLRRVLSDIVKRRSFRANV